MMPILQERFASAIGIATDIADAIRSYTKSYVPV